MSHQTQQTGCPTARNPVGALAVLLAACVLAAMAAGCGPAAVAPVPLNDTWTVAQSADYHEINKRWTRRGVLRADGQQVLEVYATLKSPAWRAAHVEYLTKVEKLSPQSRAELLAREQEAAKSGPYELVLLVSTYERRENDLSKGARSMWRMVLANDKGVELSGPEIERDRRSRDTIRAEFPHLDDFAIPYVARFPRTGELFGPDIGQIVFRMSSPRGVVELVWLDE